LAKENEQDTRYVDITIVLPQKGLTKEERKKLWDDMLHFTPQGYDIMAEQIFKTIGDWI